MSNNNKFIPEEHKRKRAMFRTLGPIILGAGILCVVIASIDFFTLDFFEEPKYFWLFFVGLPLLFVGFNICALGYGADLAKYQSRELAPVAKDTFNYLADETTEGVEAITRAVQKGKSTVVEAKMCQYCQELNKMDAKYCNECGQAL